MPKTHRPAGSDLESLTSALRTYAKGSLPRRAGELLSAQAEEIRKLHLALALVDLSPQDTIMPHSPLPIVGAHFRPPAKAILEVLPTGAELELRPEPSNPFDPNAIQVIVASSQIPPERYTDLELSASGYGFSLDDILDSDFWHLGYLPRGLAAVIAPKLAGKTYPAKLCFLADGKPGLQMEDIPNE